MFKALLQTHKLTHELSQQWNATRIIILNLNAVPSLHLHFKIYRSFINISFISIYSIVVAHRVVSKHFNDFKTFLFYLFFFILFYLFIFFFGLTYFSYSSFVFHLNFVSSCIKVA